MSYHEIDLDRHSVTVTYGISLRSWALPLELGVGGSGQNEHGFTISILCFWFAMHWWPRDYAVPARARSARHANSRPSSCRGPRCRMLSIG